MRNTYGYSSYRGRTFAQKLLTALVVILLVVLVGAVASFFLLQRYIVYTDDGQARLELPWLQQVEATQPPAMPTQTQSIVVVTTPPAPTDAPTQPEVSTLTAICPVSLFRAALTEGSTQRLVSAAGGDAAVFNMRANDGSLGYVSTLPLAVLTKSTAASSALTGQIHAVTDTELYTVARVSCFKDNLVPKVDPSLALKSVAGNNWRDAGESRWLDPANPQAQQYAAQVCGELAGLGFDEIVLDYAGYPATGSIDQIRNLPGAAAREQTLDRFYQSVADTLDGRAVLGIAVNAAALRGADPSGITGPLLAKHAQRVYVLGSQDNAGDLQALSAYGVSPDAVLFAGPGQADLSPTGRLITK